MLSTSFRNQAAASAKEIKWVHQFLEAQAEQTPTAIAVKDTEQFVTYHALNGCANHLAHYLRSQGVSHDSLVGVCVGRSLDLIVAVLAVLKAGGAYLPLDPAYPDDRLIYMMKQARVSVVITQSHLQLPLEGQQVVCLDAQWPAISACSDKNPEHLPADGLAERLGERLGERLAYVMYTSGSTGNPKGVALPHAALINLIRWQVDNSAVTTGKTLQFTPISFDVSFQEIFSTLAVGGTLVMIADETRRNPARLLKVLAQEKIERLFLPFVALQYLAEAAVKEGGDKLYLKEVITAGEQLRTTPALVQWFTQMPHCSLHNHYGPSESHVVTAHRLTGDPHTWPLLPPIGKALPHAQIHLLDENLRPVAAGDVGEIYIGGDCLAREYLHRPDLTAERFLLTPGTIKADRLYKTGDLARCLPGGEYEYLGRSDQQIKIRGYRIEPGEIEAVLEQHPAVSEAVVVAREDRPGQKRLVGYAIAPALTNQFDDLPDGAQFLKQFLQDRLPSYMVPSAVVCLETFPLTPSGKVDRRNLPAPGQPTGADFVAPKTPPEKTLAHIWETVLGVERVGLKDDFFELGGDSLLATQAITRIRETLNREVSFHQFFETSRLGALTAWLSAEPAAPERLPLKPFTHRERSPKQPPERLPLTWMQAPLWFLDQLVAQHPFYTVPEAFRLKGPLSRQALAKSVQTVVNRHETLRTTFEVVAGRPVQVIHETADCPVSEVDLSSLPEADREQEAQRQLVEAARTPFDLSKDVLLRATLFKLGETDHILLLNLHHIVCDGWSVGVLMQEIGSLYIAHEADQPSPLSPLPVQYADFTLWHQQWLQPDRCESQLTYWRQQLGDGVPRLALPTDFPRPARPTYEGGRQFLNLSDSLTQALKKLGTDTGTTLFMVLLAAFQTLLYRYSGQDDIAVGTLLANRPRPELEGLIGFFPNTVVLRSDLSGTPSFRDVLQRVREMTLGAYAHQDLPFEQLVQALHPNHEPGQNPFFHVLFNLQNTPVSDWQHPALSLTHLNLDNQTTKFDLFLELTEVGAGLTGYFEYSTDLFKLQTIERMGIHLTALLQSIVRNPDQSIAELSIFTAAELQQLVDWNNTKTEYPRHQCLPQLIEEQVRRTPRAIALQVEQARLSYDALNQRVNQCAHYLRTLGVRPGVRVGIFMERSLDLLVALLAVLKAGGAYVPLDPIYPPERLAFMVSDSKLTVLLTEATLAAKIPAATAKVVCVDTDWPVIAQQSTTNLKPINSPEDLVYILYTSGSTGKPKGVQIQHRSLVNLLWYMRQTPGITAQDTMLALTTVCFDIAVSELILPLMVGAKIVLANRETAQDPNQLARILSEAQITIAQATPSAWRILVASGWQGSPGLKMLCAGEVLSRDLADQLLQRGQALWNLYGPTETTIYSVMYPVTSGRNPVPIGRPVANTQLYLLSPACHNGETTLEPVPVGIVGELYIGGEGLAKGYLNRPELTQERFIPNPFDPDPDSRLYRTGDLARYLPDGMLECLGRSDHQIKIRGFRIELGDIEGTLRQHAVIREAVVVAKAAPTGDKQLVAYVVADEKNLEPLPQAKTQQWQTIWDETYRQSSAQADPTFNLTGWISSYTGMPTPVAEMHEWVDHTVERILALQPRRLFEIGCGTGLLLYRLAPHCQQYRGIDLSAEAIELIQDRLREIHPDWPVDLAVGAADRVSVSDLVGVDTVVINSVVQYFPSIDYLVEVLAKLVEGLQVGSRIFIGDIRSLPLLKAFHTAIQLFQADDDEPVQNLKARIQERLAQESELVIDPGLFTALQQHFSKISQVEIQLKRGEYHNELTQFRYDVVLHIGPVSAPVSAPISAGMPPFSFMRWQPGMTLVDLHQLLTETQPQRLKVEQVQNARVSSILSAMALLKQSRLDIQTVADLRAALQVQSPSQGIDPEALWQLGKKLGYKVLITWSEERQANTYDVVFQRLETDA
ncbi:MAG: amino acid adenylation domain-containing protein [Cyanobacteria bacterium P01_A01_bin.114]